MSYTEVTQESPTSLRLRGCDIGGCHNSQEPNVDDALHGGQSNGVISTDTSTGHRIISRSQTVGGTEHEHERRRPSISLRRMSLQLQKRISFRSLPHWLQDNIYLQKSHRAQLQSVRHCFRSMLTLHTETVNIWSHLIAFMFYLLQCLMIFVLKYDPFGKVDIHKLPWEDQIMVFSLFPCVMLSFFCSFLFHLMCIHSEKVSSYFGKLDYIGILLHMASKGVTFYYFGFYHSLGIKFVYTSISAILACLTFVMIFSKQFINPAYCVLRFSVFFSYILWNIIPILHLSALNGFWTVLVDWHLLCGMLIAGFGAFCYVTRVPECLAPGRFDIWGSSHQLWHIAAAIEPMVYIYGFIHSAIYYHLNETCSSFHVSPYG